MKLDRDPRPGAEAWAFFRAHEFSNYELKV